MPLVNRVRPRLGDVVEITTPRGFAYAQFTHKHDAPPRYGALIRVLPGLFINRPSEFATLVSGPSSFMTFFPLGAACHRGIVKVVANEVVPPHASTFPTFRSSVKVGPGKRGGPWYLWDGTREWRVDSLTDAELRKYPPRGIWNDTLLIERILEGWSHEKDT
jgi:hypothetical protein